MFEGMLDMLEKQEEDKGENEDMKKRSKEIDTDNSVRWHLKKATSLFFTKTKNKLVKMHVKAKRKRMFKIIERAKIANEYINNTNGI